jgi:hypothetical protein
MASLASVEISTASSVNWTTNYQAIPLPGQGGIAAAQVGRVLAMVTGSGSPSGTGYLRFVLVDKATSTLVGVLEATLTAHTGTPNRAASDGASGKYGMAVTFQNGTDLLDLLGASVDGQYQWYVGLASAFPTNVSGITLYFPWSNVI